MTIKEAAERWKISNRRIAVLCKEGRIPDAEKRDAVWFIPDGAQKPEDLRTTSKSSALLPLPIGVSSYREAVSQYYYVDKTLLIKAILDEKAKVSLFTRPRRFGKSLNMDMLRTFFEISKEDTACYFRSKKIWNCGKVYREQHGKYPLIFMTFKDVKYESWQQSLDKIADLFSLEFSRHQEVLSGADEITAGVFQRIIRKEASFVELSDALQTLSRRLHEYYAVPAVIIIDEYDVPIQQGHQCDYYDKIVLFMRNLFSAGLKDNPHLAYGFLTGILRVAKESIFSGLNNLSVNSVLENPYSEFFGFTDAEVQDMALYYGAEGKMQEIREWYDGYRFGKTEIYNPWSVINYFRSACVPGSYWQDTGSNDIIREVLDHADEGIYQQLQALITEKTILAQVDTGVIYPQVQSNPYAVFSLLLMAGYLKAERVNTENIYRLSIPNKEIRIAYKNEVLERLGTIIPPAAALTIREALYRQDAGKLQQLLRELLLQSVSAFDTASEIFYHGFVLGLCAMMTDQYLLSSNRESGQGRYDIQLLPRNAAMPGILIELKACREQKQLEKLAEAALHQIRDKNYAAEMATHGIEHIFRYGVAFCGKNVVVLAE